MSTSFRKSKGRKGNSNARAISDRSGFKFPMSEMVIEPGTGYLVHRSESDGKWNFVDHPQAHINEYVTFGDPYPVENPRPDIQWATTSSTVLGDQDGNTLAVGNMTFSLVETDLIDDYYPWPFSNR